VRIRPCMTRLSPNFVKKFVPFRKSDDKGCLQALQPDEFRRWLRDRWAETRQSLRPPAARGGRNMSIRPFLSGQEFDPETVSATHLC
jgi:hypothetical protein